jgi:hypothetical protein
MENNGGEQDSIGNQEEMAEFEDWMYDYVEMESNNSGEEGPIDDQGEMVAPKGDTDGPDVAHGDNVQHGENDQVPVETGSGIFGNTGSHSYWQALKLTGAFRARNSWPNPEKDIQVKKESCGSFRVPRRGSVEHLDEE